MTDLFRRLLKSTAPTYVQDQVNLWLDMAEDAIRKDEREQVAAWLRRDMRDSEERLRVLRRQIETATGYRGLAPHHLTQMCRARGLL